MKHICPPSHKHAETTTCYLGHACRCFACGIGFSRRVARRKQLQAAGLYDNGRTDAAPIREHLATLADAGIHYNRVATIAGISLTSVKGLTIGQPRRDGSRAVQQTIRRDLAAAILAVKPDYDALPEGAHISTRGATRRIQALVAIGYSVGSLAALLDMQPSNLGHLLHRVRITVRVHRRIANLYDRLWCVPAPATTRQERRSRTYALRTARARRWVPPLAWDDIDFDPAPQSPKRDRDSVDEVAVDLAIAGHDVPLLPRERDAAIERLVAAKWSDVAIANQLHCDERTVLRTRHRLGLPAVVDPERTAAA